MTVQELYASIGGDYAAAKKILQMDKMIERFIAKLPRDKSCEKLIEAWKAGDTQGVFEGAHALKGVCANLGLLKLSAQAGEICDEFRPGDARTMSDDEVEKKIELIRAEYEQASAQILAFAGQ